MEIHVETAGRPIGEVLSLELEGDMPVLAR
jgi:hypothetical protein